MILLSTITMVFTVTTQAFAENNSGSEIAALTNTLTVVQNILTGPTIKIFCGIAIGIIGVTMIANPKAGDETKQKAYGIMLGVGIIFAGSFIADLLWGGLIA